MDTEQEAEARIERDDGDLEDIVQVSGHKTETNRPHYHNPDCRYVGPNFRRMNRRQAQHRSLMPCAVCVLDANQNWNSNMPTDLIENVRAKLTNN